MERSFLQGRLFSATAFSIVATAAVLPAAVHAKEQLYNFTIPSQNLSSALNAFARASRQQITFDAAAVRGKKSPRLAGRYSARDALERLLANSGLSIRVGRTGLFIVENAAAPRPEAPDLSRDEERGTGEIIVTAQKREESILDVPIAVSAFSKKTLDEQKIEGGPELVRGVPNMTFSKTFSSMYNISIRGIGTKALNSSSDPGVAVSYNNTPLIRNRLFEQEFFDVSRVEVLRGPQGTLYGRNATAGVVNMIPALPNDDLAAEVKGEVGNFATKRLSGMVNVPLTDSFAIRAAGAMTKRSGFDYNSFTQKKVNGRDLWSTRLSAQWEPSAQFKVSAIWEHFNEDDDRSRSGKALCTPDPGPEMIGTTPVAQIDRERINQGCLPRTLYSDDAYGVPNSGSLTTIYIGQTSGIGYLPGPDPAIPIPGDPVSFIRPGDPYAGFVQSRDPREIATATDPTFRAKNDIFQLNIELGLADGLKLISQSAYTRDRWYSSQDYNRFLSNPVFGNSDGLVDAINRPYGGQGPTPGGIFTDPQLGPSDRMLAVDLNRTRTRQWTQELRLQSDWQGPVNFNVGVNYLDFKTRDDYYAFSNMFNLLADYYLNLDGDAQFGDPPRVATIDCPLGTTAPICDEHLYVDRHSIDEVDDQGHNYFLSRNGVRTKSAAAFGEIYWQAADNVKVTLGARYTRDKKIATQIPSQLLLSASLATGGRVNSGYPALPDIEQKWNAGTGRLVVDWKPRLSFTDDTLVYASASRGYKGGGANPPRVDFDPIVVQYLPLADRYKPEYVNAFEIGTKNSFANHRLTLNATAFFYDYKDYQISQVTDRITQTENFGAQTWGLELETAWQPSRAFRVDANLGYLRTRLKKGARSIDVMDRTQGNDDWVVLRPWLQVPSNCVAPRQHVETILNSPLAPFYSTIALAGLCPGATGFVNYDPNATVGTPLWAIFGFEYNPLLEAPNAGRGFEADLEGNELPNSPHLTFNVGAQYTFFIDNDDWELTFRGDYYRQSKSYTRIYNTEFDRLRGWGNLNLAVTLARPASDLAFQFYVKNVLDDQPITDVFLSADDIGLPANTFYLDPRIIGFSVSKKF